TSYSGEPMPVGEITEITLVMAGDASKFYVLYKDGVAYYGAEASIDGNDAVLTGVDSTGIEPGSYFTYVTAVDDDGVNTMRSTELQSFSSKSGPSGPGGAESADFAIEPYFFADGNYTEPVTEIAIGSEFALSVYAGEPGDVLLIELFHAEEPYEYVLYEDGEVFYGGAIDNEFEGPGWMTGFSSAEFEPGPYYLKIVTNNWADGTHEPAVTFTGESGAKTPPVIVSADPPAAKFGEAYSFELRAEPQYGGAISWSVTGGVLPDGLTLDPETGVISGVPTSEGFFNFTVCAEETGGGSKKKALTISVEGAQKYSVIFDLAGGTAVVGENYNARQVIEGESTVLPAAPTKSGFRFVYWLSPDGTCFLPGASVAIVADTVFTAEYAVREPLKVILPERCKDAVGTVWIAGETAGGRTDWLWSWYVSDGEVPDVLIDMMSFRYKSFIRLSLYGLVDGQTVELASYEGTVDGNTETVTLEDSGADWQCLRGVRVEGLDRTDLYSASVYEAESMQYVRFPTMTGRDASYVVYVSRNGRYPEADKYDLSSPYTTSRAEDGYLIVAPVAIADTVPVTLDCFLDDVAFYGTVYASQTINGVTHTVSAYNQYSEPTTLKLVPGVPARFSYDRYYGAYIFEGEELSLPKSGDTHTIRGRTVAADVELGIKTDADPALAAKYVRLLGGSIAVSASRTDGAEGFGYDSIPLWNISPELKLRRSVRLDCEDPDASFRMTFTADCLREAEADVRLSSGIGSAKAESELCPGAVVGIKALATVALAPVWFASDGSFIGTGGSLFYATGYLSEKAFVCPAREAGSYTLALIPAYYTELVNGKKLSEIPAEQIFNKWSFTLTDTGVTELEPFEADLAASENALFATRPYSTMHASAQSFSSTADVITLSGSIGLDPGMENGRMTRLCLDLNYERPTGFVSMATVAGETIPLSEWSVNNGCYVLTLDEPVELPCIYTFYLTPAEASMDVKAVLSADVDFVLGAENPIFRNQRIGEATVSRPGAAISVFSTYVCDETVEVSGTAKPNEGVEIFDSGVLVGTAKAGLRGKWTAEIPLDGIDDKLTTVHMLYAVSDSGVVSDAAAVIRRKDGPQLRQLDMLLYSSEEQYEVAQTSLYGSQMRIAVAVKYRVVFEHPDELQVMDEWGSKAVVRAFMGSGDIRCVPAEEQPDGTFIADFGNLNDDYIEAAEALYIPKDAGDQIVENEDGSLELLPTASDISTNDSINSALRENLTSGADGTIAYTGSGETKGLTVSFADNGEATVGGGMLDLLSDELRTQF
ncbi:MAG: putative Ig domain-containing protein, partial [Clostridia bacterium]|nr:putative Ig domain-containing protein [Clostridia bacterium]